MVEYCASTKDETAAVIAWVQTLTESHGLATQAICITPYKPEIREALTAAGFPTHELKPKEEDPTDLISGIRMGSMKRIKGLEFRAVALACADPADPLNNPSEADLLSRCERYVAASRAREHLLITLKA
jgi:superfamily I DNA/RNA helicase